MLAIVNDFLEWAGLRKKKEVPPKAKTATLRHLLNSTEIDPNRTKRKYSEKETVAYMVRRIASLEKQMKRMISTVDSLKSRFENHVAQKDNREDNTEDKGERGDRGKD